MAHRAPDPLDARLDALHASPPGDFVARRDALARELAGARDPRAEEVRRLGRPTVPVWAVNLAAREEPRALEALLASGEEVVRAHRLVLGGAGGDELLRANRALGDALEQAVASAARLAREGGHPVSASMVGRVRSTLRSMALGDAAARERLRRGRVLAESSATGLEALEGLTAARGRAAAAPAARRRAGAAGPRAGERTIPAAEATARGSGARRSAEDAREAKGREEREGRARLRAELAEARRSSRAAERDLGRSEADAGRLRAAFEEARSRAVDLEGRLRDAEARVEDARRRLEEARRLVVRLQPA